MTQPGRHSHPTVPPEAQAVAERILEDAECQACLAAKPKDER